MIRPLLASTAALAFAVTAAGCGSASSASDDPDSITISLVPSIQGEDLAEALDPLTKYLSEELDIEVNGVVANDYAATVEALGSDQAQVIITDAGSIYNAMNQYNAELILRDVRFGATSYASMAVTNDPDKYCEDEPVKATYQAADAELTYCNGLEEAGSTASGQGPKGLEALKKAKGAKVAVQATTSPAGYQYPVVAMKEQGLNPDSNIEQIPVEGNNNAVIAVANGDAEVGFAFWDARSEVLQETPDIGDKAVALAYSDMIPNGGVAVAQDLPEDLKKNLTDLMDNYADSSDEAKTVMQDLVNLSDWTTELEEDQIQRYGEILEEFSQ